MAERFVRHCIDKVFLSCYDEDYSRKNHDYDLKLKDKLIHSLALVQFRHQREHVVRFQLEDGTGSLDIRLRKTRGAFLRTNLIERMKLKKGLSTKRQLVLHGENFLPLDVQLPLSDFLAELRQVSRSFSDYYHSFVLEHWDTSLRSRVVSVSQIEAVREVYPFSVSELGDFLQASEDKQMVRFTNQNATIYLNSTDSETSPQLKIYQKAPGLARFELTFHGQFASQLFAFSKTDREIEQDVFTAFEKKFYEVGLSPDLLAMCDFSVPYSDVCAMLGSWFKEPKEVINILKNSTHIQTDRGNRVLAQRLSRKRLILRTSQRGYYKVNPVLRQLFQVVEEFGVMPSSVKL